MNILILHRMGDPYLRREAVKSLEYMLTNVRYDFNYIVHDTDLNLPDYIKDLRYDLIILGPTFLGSRYDSNLLSSVFKEYDFIKHSDACKIALPQDDYDCSGILDKWMIDWNIDCIYTPCPDKWDILYQNSIKKINIRLGYTGYISENWIRKWAKPKTNSQRKIDVSYRATKLPENFGSLGLLKYEIAHKFLNSLPDQNAYVTDISVSTKDIIAGDKWHDFLENSKFCLVTPSGSSIIDPWNKIRQCVNNAKKINKNIKFEDLSKICFPDQDGLYNFTALSPRNIEAALAETVQIATYGNYSGLMEANNHYILLKEDCSNISDIIKIMNDNEKVLWLKKSCKESILSEKRLRQETIVKEIISLAESIISARNVISEKDEKIKKIINKYNKEIPVISRKHWNKIYRRRKLYSIANKYGYDNIKRYIKKYLLN